MKNDEADQASLNIEVKKESQSATYDKLLAIRDALPQHTYLQYTATPQAPLLINLIDVLSPEFVEVLTPGDAYTGGQAFFGPRGDLDLICRIRDDEVPKQLSGEAPPDSLLEALRLFFLGVAAGSIRGATSNRTMMVHPAMETATHVVYERWVRSLKSTWVSVLGAPADDADRSDLVGEFQDSYTALRATVQDLPPFQSVIDALHNAILQTTVMKLNASTGRTPDIEWSEHYARILVGGEVLNRGFTVEGLTVTYMPRGRGMGQADTLQQRARWFGYKEEYLGYCRVFLTDDLREIYEAYVDHEEDLRGELRTFSRSGKPLAEWRRAFFLDSRMKPTRDAVLNVDYARGNYSDKWFTPGRPHASADGTRSNAVLVQRWRAAYADVFEEDSGSSGRTVDQRHLVAHRLPLGSVYEQLMSDFHFASPGDSKSFTGLLLQVKRYLDGHPGEVCSVYLMRKGEARRRSLDEKSETIKELFQGRSDKKDEQGAWTYPGDDEIRINDELSIQIHRLDLELQGSLVARDVPALAVWVPRRMGAAWLVGDNVVLST